MHIETAEICSLLLAPANTACFELMTKHTVSDYCYCYYYLRKIDDQAGALVTNWPIFLTHHMPSVLWCCWLGGMKGIQLVKNWVVGSWRGCVWVKVQIAYGPADATATHHLLLQ